MNPINLFYFSYWFSQPNPAAQWVQWVWSMFFLFLVVLGIALLFIKRTKEEKAIQKVLQRYSNCFLTIGILGLLFFFFRQERVVFLGWRFWFLGGLTVFLVWLYRLVDYSIKRIPQIRVEQQERERRGRYLPKSQK